MKTLYNIHWVPEHAGGDDEAWIARWAPSIVKVICTDETVPKIEYIPPASKILVRNHPLSENYGRGRVLVDVADAQQKGREAGEVSARTAEWCEVRGINRSRLLFEGLNEPQVYAGEPPALLASYEVARLEVLHRGNVRGVVCNFGVGWPGNDGTTGGLPIWGPYGPIINAMLPGDYLGLHEYWALDGPDQNWGWWAGRFEKCPYNVPIITTECGIDLGVAGQPYGGWFNLPGNHDQQAAQYMNQLVRYEERCRQDKRIRGLFIYTYDYGSNHWELMSIRDGVFMPQFFQYLDWLAPQIEPPPQQPADRDGELVRLLSSAFGAKFLDLRAPLPRNPAVPWFTDRPLAGITSVVVHHTAGAEADTWANIAQYHITAHNWPSVAYTIGVHPDGTVSLLGDIEEQRGATDNATANATGVQVCAVGNYDLVQPSAEMAEALAKVCTALEARLGRPLAIRGHKDVDATACPGKFLYALIAPEAPVDIDAATRNAAWNAMGIPLNPDSAFYKYALAHGLGIPRSGEFDYAGRRGQAFNGGIVSCPIGQWDAITVTAW